MSVTSYLGVRSHKDSFITRTNYEITRSFTICSELLSQQHINKNSVVCLCLNGPKIISYQNYEIFQKNRSMEGFGNELLKHDLHFFKIYVFFHSTFMNHTTPRERGGQILSPLNQLYLFHKHLDISRYVKMYFFKFF